MASAIGPFQTEVIIVEQRWNRAKMSQLWKMRDKLDTGVSVMLDCLYKGRNKGTITGSTIVKYKLGGWSTKSESWAGKLGFGRLYGSVGSLEMMENDVRGTLCGEFYYDVDIANCHPELIHQMAKMKFNLDMPECQKFCKNRSDYYAMLSDNRDFAKTEIFKMLYGDAPLLESLKPFKAECDNLARLFATEEAYLPLLLGCKTHKPTNMMGSFLSYVIQTEERRCLLALRQFFATNGWSVDVLAYDGVMIRKRDDKPLNPDELNEATRFIQQETGYAVKLTTKDFSSIKPEELTNSSKDIVDGVSQDTYLKAKSQFEDRYFYHKPSNQIGEIDEGGKMEFYDMEHAREICKTEFSVHNKEGKKVSLFDTWRNDDEKRIVKKIQFEPSDDKSVLVLPMTFKYLQHQDAIQELPADKKQTVIDTFKNLISINTSHTDSETTYLTKFMAHILQKPLDLPRVGCLITGNQGAFKDYIWDFIGTEILGSTYFTDYDKNTQFFDKYDTAKESKFLIKLQEADSEFCKKHASDLKATITSQRLKFNPKGQKCYERDNYGRFILTTNKANPLDLEQSDRRWLMFRNSNELCLDFKRGEEIRNVLENKYAGAIVAEWLLSVDISNFDPNRDKPESEFKKMVLESEMSSEERFLQHWDGEELSASDFYAAYKDFCFMENIDYANNQTSFGRKMLKPMSTGMLLKHRKSDVIIYKKP